MNKASIPLHLSHSCLQPRVFQIGHLCRLAQILLPVFCMGLLATAQTLPPPLANPVLDLRSVPSGLELNVSPDAEAGVVYLFEGQNLDSLLSEPTILVMTNMPVADDLRIPLASTNSSRFFNALRLRGSMEDFAAPDFPEGEESPFVLWTLGFPATLVSGVTYTADFLLIVSTNALAAYTGSAQLSVVRLEDGTPHPDAIVSPETIFFSQGACRTNVQVTASTSLAGYVVAVTLTDVETSAEKDGTIVSAASSSLQLVPIINLPDAPLSASEAFVYALAGVEALVDTPGWSLPLPDALPEVSGTFGEWRGHIRSGVHHANVHAGLDLVASAGTTVTAARGGIVSAKGDASGKYVTIDHLDGWYSQYLHLSASELPDRGSYLARGADVGVVGTTADTGLAEHLHFELRRAAAPGETGGFPGNGLDPLQQADMFAVRSPARNAVVTNIGITSVSPATQNYSLPKQPVAGSAQTVYVVLQILQAEPKVNASAQFRRLSPRGINFQPQSGQPLTLTTPDETAIGALKPASTPAAAGFARYLHGTTTTVDWTKVYKYWFRWDVSSYITETNGPRTFTVQTTNYANMVRSDTLKWGPQILSVEPVGPPSNDEQRYRVRVRSWRGEANATDLEDIAAGDWAVGADWLRYELPTGGKWVEKGQANYEEEGQSTGISKIRTQDFLWSTLPGGEPNPFVTVRSRTITSIAHQVDFLPDCPIGSVTPGPNMAFIPAGSFMMGDNLDGSSDALPLHSVYVSAFYMDRYEVTKALWDEVYTWAVANGYTFEYGALGKATTHPAQAMTWYDAVKWCNARSEKEGRVPAYYTSAEQTTVYRSGQVNVQNEWVKWCTGYRLPTEAEWEKAARGGSSGQRFPWGNTITHSQANYYSYSGYAYDTSPTRNNHPTFNDGVTPYTSPVGYFGANGYGLYDMAGNVREWCWDWYSSSYYSSSPGSDPRGPISGSTRVLRGGCWNCGAIGCRTADRGGSYPTVRNIGIGFRSVLPSGQ